MFYQKLLRVLLVIGLFGLIVLSLKNRMPKIVVRCIALFSKYRALMSYMLAHAKHETNNFTSFVYLNDHNLYGMKWTNGRRGQVAEKGTESPEGDNYARYKSDSVSVVDLLLWFEATKFPVKVDSAAQYVRELKERGYFTAGETAYLNRINFWLKA